MSQEATNITLKTDLAAKLLFATIALLSIASLTALGLRFYGGFEYAYGMVPLISMDEEGNIPTYFSSLLHLTSAVLLFLITLGSRQDGHNATWKWAGLSLVFLFLSVDEASSIHELLTYPVREFLGAGGVLYFAWVVPAIILIVIFTFAYWPFLRTLPSEIFRGFILAAIVFLSGAIGMELVGGWIADTQGADTLQFFLATEVEEVLEMTGSVIFIRTLLTHLSTNVGAFQISFR